MQYYIRRIINKQHDIVIFCMKYFLRSLSTFYVGLNYVYLELKLLTITNGRVRHMTN